MSDPYKPFDARAQQLIGADPLAWLHFLGLPGKAAELFDSDVATIVQESLQ